LAAQPAPVPRNVTPQEDAVLRSAARRGAKIIRPAPVPVPLTDEQIDTLIMQHTGGFIGGMHFVHLARAIERAHGIAASPEVPK
jgi:hypothetical protein